MQNFTQPEAVFMEKIRNQAIKDSLTVHGDFMPNMPQAVNNVSFMTVVFGLIAVLMLFITVLLQPVKEVEKPVKMQRIVASGQVLPIELSKY